MADIESAYLNADQEQKVENMINLGKELGFNVQFNKVQIPQGLGSIRVVIEAKTARDYVQFLYNFGFTITDEQQDVVKYFDEVLETELEQIKNGVQEFVAEKDEADQA